MLAGRARVLQETDTRKVRPLYHGTLRWSPVWDGNPRIARLEEQGDLQVIHARDMANNRPYHLGHDNERWVYNPAFRPDVGELYLTPAEKAFAAQFTPGIIIEPHLQARASPNKQWGWVRWNKLAWLLARSGHRVTQLGPRGTKTLDGVELIETFSYRQACAVLERAPAAALPEGGLHHAAAFGISAVVIFGGFTPVELTGYALHRNLGASFGDACGMRVPCDHCKAWMESITPEAVFENLMELLNDRARVDRGVAENAA